MQISQQIAPCLWFTSEEGTVLAALERAYEGR
jgi:hypothetical protein